MCSIIDRLTISADVDNWRPANQSIWIVVFPSFICIIVFASNFIRYRTSNHVHQISIKTEGTTIILIILLSLVAIPSSESHSLRKECSEELPVIECTVSTLCVTKWRYTKSSYSPLVVYHQPNLSL